MKVGELINILQQCNQNAEIKLASDAEGNKINDVDDVGYYEDDDEKTLTIYPV